MNERASVKGDLRGLECMRGLDNEWLGQSVWRGLGLKYVVGMNERVEVNSEG